MKKTISFLALAAAMLTANVHAGICDTFAESNARYHSTGTWVKDHYEWDWKGVRVVGCFDHGVCDVCVLYSNDVRYYITYKQARTLLRNWLPSGGMWHNYYSDASNGDKAWSTVIDGTTYYAMYWRGSTWSRATGNTSTTYVRIGTADGLARIGAMPSDSQETVSVDDNI